MNESQPLAISNSSRAQIAEILGRRANEIAGYHMKHRDALPSPVEFALCREIDRLRELQAEIAPPKPQSEDEN